MYRTRKIISIMLFFLILAGCASGNKYDHSVSSNNKQSDSLKNTVITPYMEAKLVSGKNMIFCSTFQLAWNEIKDNIIKEDIKISDDTGMVKFLNQGKSTKKDISDDSYVAMAGLAKDKILDKINSALNAKFKDVEPVKVDFNYPEDIFAYAYLYKNLRFENEFEAIETPLFYRGNNVKSFGIEKYTDSGKHKKLGNQVDVIDYKNRNDFIIRLKPTSKTDEIILAKVSPNESLYDTIDRVKQRINQSKPMQLEKNDILIIPKLNFNITHNYSELKGKTVQNKGFDKYFVNQARQDILFSLDEKGAILKSEARIWFPAKSIEESRELVFDSPFLLYIMEKDAEYPYFAMWVDNSELMVK